MRLKIICLNIWIGGILFDEAVSFLKSQQPDIVLLQEAYNGEDSSLATQHRTYTALKEQLQFPYSHFASAFLEELNGQYIQQGNAILSKYPLEELAVVFYDEPFGVRDNRRAAFHQTPRNLQHVVVDVQDTKLHLLNTQGIWGKDGEDSPRRLAMSETILAEVGENAPLVLAGDFNLQPHTRTIKNIEAKLQNVFKNEAETSFNLQRKDLQQFPGYTTAVVDMFFVSPDVKIISKSMPQVDISDHLPLVVEVAI